MRLIASFLSWLSEESSSRPSFLIQLLILLCPKFLKLSISKLELFKGSSSTDPYYNIIEEILIFFERVFANFIFLILTPKPSNSTSKFLNSGFFCSLRCSFQVYGNLVYESESSYVSCLLHNSSMTFFFFQNPGVWTSIYLSSKAHRAFIVLLSQGNFNESSIDLGLLSLLSRLWKLELSSLWSKQNMLMAKALLTSLASKVCLLLIVCSRHHAISNRVFVFYATRIQTTTLEIRSSSQVVFCTTEILLGC